MALLSSTRKAATLSPPLPINNSILNRHGLAFRRGQFSLLAAAPGVGKSLFATNLAIRTPIPALFFSADSDEWTVKTRACSILTGTPLDDVDKQLSNPNDEAWEDYYAGHLRQADHVDWCFQTDLDMEFVVFRLQAHAEMRGDYPHLIVVDNLGNTVDPENEGTQLKANCQELQRIARSTNSHVLALHHVKGAKEDGTRPIGLGDLLYNTGKIPELVLGLSRSGENECHLTVCKNRGGKSGQQLQLPVHYATATIGGYGS